MVQPAIGRRPSGCCRRWWGVRCCVRLVAAMVLVGYPLTVLWSTQGFTTLQRIDYYAAIEASSIEGKKKKNGRSSSIPIHYDAMSSRQMTADVSHLANVQLQPCGAATSSSLKLAPCSSSASSLYFYNPSPDLERHVCGRSIPPRQYIALPANTYDDACGGLPPRLFANIPTISDSSFMPPIVLRFDDARHTRNPKPFACDVPCHDAGTAGTLSTRTIGGTPWSFLFSMEGPDYYPALKVDRTAYLRNRFYATTSFESEVPLPYYSQAEYNIQNPALNYGDAVPAAVFLARNCNSLNGREAIVTQLAQHFRVDSLSSCLRNAKPPSGVKLQNKLQVMRKYLFYLAFENQNVDDYITEKLWGSLESGSVPVYFGAPNVKEHAPNNSLIAVSDFGKNNIAALGAYLARVAANQTLYESFHAWRSQPLPPHFVQRYRITDTHSTCRMCRWAYAKKYGLGWHHGSQSVREPRLSRQVCVNNQGLVTRPVAEQWYHGNDVLVVKYQGGSSGPRPLCSNNAAARHVSTMDSLQRTLYIQDGIFDMLIESTGGVVADENAQLQLGTTLRTDEAQSIAVGAGHWRLQDRQSRVTLLIWPQRAAVRVVQSNAWRITATSLPLRLRVIVEDVDTFHQGADQLENYFAQQMKADFYLPVEVFVPR